MLKKKKKTSRRTKSSKSSAAKLRHKIHIKYWLKRFCFLAVIFAIIGLAYLDVKIRQQFEGQRWALPAHVYTRPMELYVGQRLNVNELKAELQELGYQHRTVANNVGSYAFDNNRIEIYQRAFVFWDGPSQAKHIAIGLSGKHEANKKISYLQADGDSLDIIRLEPRLFGSVSPLSHEDRSLVKLQDVPLELIMALLAIEDRKFFSHFGIDPFGIARAMIKNILAGRLVQGGSTLTQQLIKNYYLNADRTVKRKLTEMIMAILLELHYSKEEILEAYINEIYLSQSGNRAIHGFGLGSRFFFGRPLNELSLSEMATLVGMLKGPSSYNPIRNPERATKRRNLVLKAMLEQDFINYDQWQQASTEQLYTANEKQRKSPLSYPAFLDLVRQDLKQDYNQEDLLNEGLRIFTTLNPRIQNKLEQAIKNELSNIERARKLEENSLQAAALVARTDNGEVVAMVGGREARFAGYNRALDAMRPMGSLIKPVVYLTALEQAQNYSLATVLKDTPITVSQHGSADWQPQNYDNKAHGDVLLIDALAKSYNLSTVRLGMELGLPSVASTLKRLGYSGQAPKLPSMLLGAVPMNLQDVGQIYLTMAAGGFKTPMKGIRSVLSKENQPLTRYPLSVQQVVEPEFNTLINFALQEVVRNGTGRSVNHRFKYDYGLAGKTGTTDNYRDSWFAGFSGNYLTVVWVGRDDNQPTGLTGATGAARVWSAAMSNIPQQRLELDMGHGISIQKVVSGNYTGHDADCVRGRTLPISEKSLPVSRLQCSVVAEEVLSYQSEYGSNSRRAGSKPSWFEKLFR